MHMLYYYTEYMFLCIIKEIHIENKSTKLFLAIVRFSLRGFDSSG